MNNLKAYFVPHPPLIVPEIGKGEEHAIKKTIDAYQHIAKEIADDMIHSFAKSASGQSRTSVNGARSPRMFEHRMQRLGFH